MSFLELRETVKGESSLLSAQDFNSKFLERFRHKPKSDWYRSLYVYDKIMNEHFKDNKSVKGYDGPASAGYLFFDLDNSNLDKAKEDTRELLRKLCTISNLKGSDLLKHIDVFFSGNKGFHVFFHVSRRFSPEEMKNACTGIAGDLESFDSSIYNKTRIIRIENTIHQKSKLYKIRLNVKMLSGKMSSIKDLANKTSTVDLPSPIKFEGKLNIETKIKSKAVVVDIDDEDEIEGVRGLHSVDFTKCPKNWPRCIYAMSKGIMVPGRGERHQIFLALTRFFRNQGYEQAHTHRLLKGVAELNHALYPESELYKKDVIWNECVQSVYGDKGKFLNKGGWGVDPKNDHIFQRYCKLLDNYCNSKCCMHQKRDKTKTLFTASEMITGYKRDFARNYKKSIIKTGMNFLDKDLEIRKRTVTLIVGSAGSGKTTFALKILENCNSESINSVFFCMDMDMYSILEKLGEKHTKHKRKMFREAFRKLEEKEPITDNERVMIEDIENAIKTHYSKTIFDYSATLSMDDMRDRVLEIEEVTGEKVGMVLVDYASRITSHKTADYENQKYNALRSKEVAQQTDAAWIYLCQTSRNSGDSHIPLRTKRAAKGAGDWEEAAQSVITVWRPFAGMDGTEYTDEGGETHFFRDNIMRVYIAKNRMGLEKEVVLAWVPQDGIMEEFNDEDSAYYKDSGEPLEKLALKYKTGRKFGD